MAKRVAIRTDGKFEHREDTINSITSFYDCNRTRALLAAADDIPHLAKAIERVLSRDDLTRQQRTEIAAELSTSSLQFDVDVTVTRRTDP